MSNINIIAEEIIKKMIESKPILKRTGFLKFLFEFGSVLKALGAVITIIFFIFLIFWAAGISIQLFDTNTDVALYGVAMAAFILQLFCFFIEHLSNSLNYYTSEYVYYAKIGSIDSIDVFIKELNKLGKKNKLIIKNMEVVEIRQKLFLKIIYY